MTVSVKQRVPRYHLVESQYYSAIRANRPPHFRVMQGKDFWKSLASLYVK